MAIINDDGQIINDEIDDGQIINDDGQIAIEIDTTADVAVDEGQRWVVVVAVVVVVDTYAVTSVAVAVAHDDGDGGDHANKGDAEEEFAEEGCPPVFVDAHLLWRKEQG